MDHTLSLPVSQPQPVSVPGPPAVLSGSSDEDPDSPGRSPRVASAASPSTAADASDPLSEGLGFLGGVAIAMLALVVPLAVVICDPVRAPQPITGRMPR